MRMPALLWNGAVVLWLAGLAGFFVLDFTGADDAAMYAFWVGAVSVVIAVIGCYGFRGLALTLLAAAVLGLGGGMLLDALGLPSWLMTPIAVVAAVKAGGLIDRLPLAHR